jgi:hypothetical protein
MVSERDEEAPNNLTSTHDVFAAKNFGHQAFVSSQLQNQVKRWYLASELGRRFGNFAGHF